MSVRGYADLQLDAQQLEVLQRRQQLAHRRQHMTHTRGEGGVQEVKRVDDPDVVQVRGAPGCCCQV